MNFPTCIGLKCLQPAHFFPEASKSALQICTFAAASYASTSSLGSLQRHQRRAYALRHCNALSSESGHAQAPDVGPPPTVPPEPDPYTGGLSAAVFQRLAFLPGNPPGSHHRPRARNLDSSSNTYGAACARRVDSGGNPAKPPSGSHWPPKPPLGATRVALRTKALIPRAKMN